MSAVTLLVAEFLERWEAGDAPDPDDFRRRAGARGDELMQRLAILADLAQASRHALRARDADADAADDVDAGVECRRLDRFELRRRLGSGGLADVYLGWDLFLRREVAVKVLAAAIPPDEARAWTQSEGRLLAQLEHDSIVRVYEVGQDQGETFIAMERVRGPRLHEVLLAMRGQLAGVERDAVEAAHALAPLPARCRLVAQLARALCHAHDQGVVHRDVKPANVLLEARSQPPWRPKLIDFGLGQLESDATDPGVRELFGTEPYLAPEQVRSGSSGASEASDQFSLGIVFYELLTLVHPFQRDTSDATQAAIADARPVPPRKRNPALPSDLARICLHCLERVEEDRYPSLGHLADDLDAFLGYRAISLEPRAPAKRLRLWLARHRAQWVPALIAASLLALVGLGLHGRAYAAERDELATRLAGLRARAATCAEPAQLEELFGELALCGERAATLREVPLWPRLYADAGADVDAAWALASARAASAIEQEFERAHDERVAKQIGLTRIEGRYVEINRRWSGSRVVQRKAALDPGRPLLLEDVGRVTLPADGELWRYDARSLPMKPALTLYEDPTGLSEGLYRFCARRGDVVQQVDFFVHPLRAPWTLELHPTPAWVAERMVAVAEGVVAAPPSWMWYGEPFELLATPVTWAEVESVFTPSELELCVFLNETEAVRGLLGPEDPAVVPAMIAQELAYRVGARLPTASELGAAARAGLVVLDERLRGEHVASVWGKNYAMQHVALYEGLLTSENGGGVLAMVQDDGFYGGAGVRLARGRSRGTR